MDYHIDAKNKILGRVATEIALILQGKKSASYVPHQVSNDKVYVKNYAEIAVTGKKLVQKVYYRHTGYVGHLKEARLEERLAKVPKTVIREAVRKMLPKNFLNQRRLKNLIFVEADGATVLSKGRTNK
jgi:large subunit ribosomal protein L13